VPAPSTAANSGREETRRLDRSRSLLLVIDIQERLAPHVLHGKPLIARSAALLAGARRLGIPAILTEHCPGQIGRVVAELRTQFAAGEVFEKTHFGAADHPEFVARVEALRRDQIVVAGMEAHVCVLQTVLGLAARGYAVTLAGDAVGSRAARQDDRRFALDRMRGAGAVIAGTETLLFEWTQAGDDAAFRDILALVKSLPPADDGAAPG
jgi:nicotinamidase-related amidase